MSEAGKLRPVSARLPLSSYLKDLWKRRFFIASFARARVEGQNSNAVLGQAWLLLTPMLTAAVYYLLFGVILGTTRGIDNFVLFLIIGVLIFRFTSSSTTAGGNSIISNQGLIRSLHFPRALLPIASTLQQLIQVIPALVIIVACAFLTGESIRWQWILIFPALMLQFIFTTGLSLFLARLVSEVRDFAKLSPFLIRMWGYLSGIFFSVEAMKDRFPASSEPFLLFNPLYIYMELARSCFMESAPASSQDWLLGLGWAVLFLVIGFSYFFKGEGKYGRD